VFFHAWLGQTQASFEIVHPINYLIRLKFIDECTPEKRHRAHSAAISGDREIAALLRRSQ
jgi:hypothetical protein